MQLDADAVEKLMINVDDFSYALENDVKPVCYQSLICFKALLNNSDLELNKNSSIPIAGFRLFLLVLGFRSFQRRTGKVFDWWFYFMEYTSYSNSRTRCFVSKTSAKSRYKRICFCFISRLADFLWDKCICLLSITEI